MKTSDSIIKISAALLKAQKAIKFAAKDANNDFFKSAYADLPSVIIAVKPALNEAGIVFMQSSTPCDAGTLGLTTRLQHESGEWIEDTAMMPLSKNDPQGFGSAMTYARRYSLAAMTGLYQDDDDGNLASLPERDPAKITTPTVITPALAQEDLPKQVETVLKVYGGKVQSDNRPITEAQQKLIFARTKISGISEEKVREFMKKTFAKEHTKELTRNELNEVLKFLETKHA